MFLNDFPIEIFIFHLQSNLQKHTKEKSDRQVLQTLILNGKYEMETLNLRNSELSVIAIIQYS